MSTLEQSTAYNFNFCFPVCELESERVKLLPFLPAQHADLFVQGTSTHLTELYQYLPFGPYSTSTDFVKGLIYGRIQPDPGMMLYAIIDKTRSPTDPGSCASPSATNFAGIIGYLCGSPANLSIEIGLIIILPPFQHTHVTSNAVGLLLRYALDLPTASPPGLGLRRVQWKTSERNNASIKVAERMGFTREALLRWDTVFPGGQGKVGNGEAIREGDLKPGTLGRHTVVLANCWDDWENGKREQVARLMDR